MLVTPARHETLTKADIKRLRKTAPKQEVAKGQQTRVRQVPDGRANLKPWPKGVSGNPDGKNKRDIAALCRLHTSEALAALVHCLGVEKYAVQAAVAILDRGYGKPQQTIENNTTITIRADELSDDELARLVGVGAARQPKTIEHDRGNADTAPQTLPSRDAVDVIPNDVNDLG